MKTRISIFYTYKIFYIYLSTKGFDNNLSLQHVIYLIYKSYSFCSRLFCLIVLCRFVVNIILSYTEQLDKHPNQYPNDKDIRVKALGLELGASKGELAYWYECLSNKRGYSTKIKDLSIKKYKQILWNKIEDILEIAGYEVGKIKQDLLYETENMIIASNNRKLFSLHTII